jgi:hypothetical protein
MIHNRKKVIYLTPEANKIGDLVRNWKVYEKAVLADHRYMCFK